MASTYTVANAVSYVQPFIKNIPVTSIQVVAADLINSIIWTAYPWRWSLVALTAITITDGNQDHGTGAPADYFRLVRARVRRTDVTPNQFNDILVMRWLPPELTKAGFSNISSICYEAVLDRFRTNFAVSVPSGVTLKIEADYQKQVSKITATTATFAFPDQFFNVFIEGLKWQFFLFADDPRAGSAESTKSGTVVYVGQLGLFHDALLAMREAEEWGAGDTLFPTDPLGAYRVSNPNLFGP